MFGSLKQLLRCIKDWDQH